MSRQAQYAKINIARKDLGMDEDSYRAMLTRITGKDSLTTCNYYQLEAVIDELKVKGFKPRSTTFKSRSSSVKKPSKRVSNPATPDMRDKALAVWIELAHLEIIKDGSDLAFAAYCRKRTDIDHWHWLPEKQAYSIIEGLKTWLARETLKRLVAALNYPYTEQALLELAGALDRGVFSINKLTSAMANNAIRKLAQRHVIDDIVSLIRRNADDRNKTS